MVASRDYLTSECSLCAAGFYFILFYVFFLSRLNVKLEPVMTRNITEPGLSERNAQI